VPTAVATSLPPVPCPHISITIPISSLKPSPTSECETKTSFTHFLLVNRGKGGPPSLPTPFTLRLWYWASTTAADTNSGQKVSRPSVSPVFSCVLNSYIHYHRISFTHTHTHTYTHTLARTHKVSVTK